MTERLLKWAVFSSNAAQPLHSMGAITFAIGFIIQTAFVQVVSTTDFNFVI